MTQPQTIDTFDITPGPDSVSQVLRWLDGLAAREGWANDVRHRLALSLDEALTNIVDHAFHPKADLSAKPLITLAYMRQGDTLIFDVLDNAPGFDPTQAPIPPLADDLDSAVMGGHGLRLMLHYLDKLQYNRINGYNRLRLSLKSSPPRT